MCVCVCIIMHEITHGEYIYRNARKYIIPRRVVPALPMVFLFIFYACVSPLPIFVLLFNSGLYTYYTEKRKLYIKRITL